MDPLGVLILLGVLVALPLAAAATWLGLASLWDQAELRSRRAMRLGSALHHVNWGFVALVAVLALVAYAGLR